jgi:hypothetical protein
MENQKQKKSVGTIALVVLLLIVTIASLVLATYAWAKYTSKTSGTAQAEVAKWDVTFSNVDSDFTGTYTHIAAGNIAPGASGTFDITVNPGATETCFDYVIKIDSFEFVDENGDVLATSTPLESTTDATATMDGVTSNVTIADLRSHIVVTDEDGHRLTTGSESTTGAWHISSCANYAANQDLTKTISWAWAYEGTGDDAAKARYDAVDTAAGRYVAAGNTLKLKFNYTITAKQIAPVRAAAQQNP